MRAKSSRGLRKSCNISIKHFLKKDEKRESSVVEQINSIYNRKDFGDLKFDLKETMSNNGFVIATTARNVETQKGYEKPLNKNANHDDFQIEEVVKKQLKRRIKSGNPLHKHSKENNLLLFPRKATK